MRLLDYRWSYYLEHPTELFKELIWRPFKYFALRLKHGFDIRDTWSLNYSIAKFTLPRIKYLRDNLHSYPVLEDDNININTFEDWQATVDKMIFAFQSILDEEDNFTEWYKQFELATEHKSILTNRNIKDVDYEKLKLHYEKRREGLEIFGKYFEYLWD